MAICKGNEDSKSLHLEPHGLFSLTSQLDIDTTFLDIGGTFSDKMESGKEKA